MRGAAAAASASAWQASWVRRFLSLAAMTPNTPVTARVVPAANAMVFRWNGPSSFDQKDLVGRGEVLADAQTVDRCGQCVQIGEWRSAEDSSDRFAVISALLETVEPAPWPTLNGILSDDQIRPWLLPAVYDRLREGLGEFLTDLRPAVALFLRFFQVPTSQ